MPSPTTWAFRWTSFSGEVLAVKGRIRLIRSFDQISHQYQGYTLVLRDDEAPETVRRIAIGPGAHAISGPRPRRSGGSRRTATGHAAARATRPAHPGESQGGSRPYNTSGPAFTNGNLYLGQGATYTHTGASTVNGTIFTYPSSEPHLSNAISQAQTQCGSFYPSQPCNQTFNSINLKNSSQTIFCTVPGQNVVCINNGVTLAQQAVLTLNCPATDTIILNIKGNFTVSGASRIVTSGGLQPNGVLLNSIGTGNTVVFSGGSIMNGSVCAPLRKCNPDAGVLNGAVLCGNDMSIASGEKICGRH